MKTVKIAELRNRLSHYLRRVQRGESILVCERDRVIARIDRVEAQVQGSATEAEWLSRLERQGVVRRGKGKLTKAWLARRPPIRADVVAALLKEREEGR
jgi:antitoxin (DNA-binding transcriptional repressor) of toxin-antitoxin stability system